MSVSPQDLPAPLQAAFERMTREGGEFPPIDEALLAKLEAIWTPRCMMVRGETVEEHLYFAGACHVVRHLRDIQRIQKDRAREAAEGSAEYIDIDQPGRDF